MVYVNWKLLLEAPPDSLALRQVLCSGNPEVLRGLYRYRFTEYFTNERPAIPELGRVIALFRNKDTIAEIQGILCEFLQQYPIPYFLFHAFGIYDGSCRQVDAFPQWIDGQQNRFLQAQKGRGNSALHQNISYVVIVNQIITDPVYNPYVNYMFLAIPRAVFQLEPEYSSAFELEIPILETSLP